MKKNVSPNQDGGRPNDSRLSRRDLLTTLAGAGIVACSPCAITALPIPQSTPASPRRIDVHHHILPPRYLTLVRERIIAAAGATADLSPLMNWSPARAIEEMDKNGVAAGITSLGLPGTWFGSPEAARQLTRSCNEFAADMVRNYPGRFGMFAALPMPDQEGSLREIEYALDTLKADGFALLTNYGDKWTGDTAYVPVFEELHRRKAIVHVHPAAPACCSNLLTGLPPSVTEFLFDTARSVASLLISGIFARYPDIRFIFSHGGGALPAISNRLVTYFKSHKDLTDRAPNGALFELKKLYYDIANSTTPSPMAALMALAPVSQILFGGDFPYVSINATADGLDKFGLPGNQRQAINRDNAAALFPRFK